MKAEISDIQWLRENQPRLFTGIHGRVVIGMLEISAYYETEGQQSHNQTTETNPPQIHISTNPKHKPTRKLITTKNSRNHQNYVSDQFLIQIDMISKDENGWPKVYETANRHKTIAKRYKITETDLHFYKDGSTCLGIPHPEDKIFTLSDFIESMVEPFFYILAYVDLYGIETTRKNLWGEYSHGKTGLLEHQRELKEYYKNKRNYQR